MTTSYTGVRVIKILPELVDKLYTENNLDISFNKTYKFWQNEYVVVKDNAELNKSAITKCVGDRLVLIKQPEGFSVSGVRPRNKEQRMTLDALLDPAIKVVVITGISGSGKTLMALGAALANIDKGSYSRLILTRPMSWVGKHGLGYLPGDESEKFGPYLENYMCNIQHLLNGKKKSIQDVIDQYAIEFIPLQLIRGASWSNAFIVADEVQTLNYHEMVTLGTRVGEGSKIVIAGDLDQRDEKIKREKTGIYKLVNSQLAKESPLVASIDLIKSERSNVCELFSQIFERKTE